MMNCLLASNNIQYEKVVSDLSNKKHTQGAGRSNNIVLREE